MMVSAPLLVFVAAVTGQATAFTTTPRTSTFATALHATTEAFSVGEEFANEAALFEASTFPISPEKLKERAKEVLSPEIALGTQDGGDCLADNFEFCAAVVGPIGKQEYLNALGTFKLQDGFDLRNNHFGMTVDPLQPNRIWLFSRIRAIHTGTFMGVEPSGKEIVYPPQIQHIDFDEQGKVVEFGFYTADRRQGNTGGLGGAFGFMYGVGKPLPIPECQPYKPSKRFRFLMFLGSLGRRFQKK
ncbi:expressed unknown protein [Seminavis robusta]|uniref:Uncharacterized protein n=1 Tax=Seminavis robusta TaxID=568900 RepID=A0A9N8HWU3_9STRA|nr:expressed unknown protein [Seminavis robusta]|eukprot:Sro2044_g312390.1 n/a (244) ;mRNA; r:11652-12383